MPTATTGIYELVLEQTYLGQIVTNVFHYLHTLGANDAQAACINAFEDDVMAPISLVQSNNLDYTNIRCANLTGFLADVNVVPTVTSGTLGGFDAASFIAVPLRYARTTKDTRNGSKRLSGMLEENMEEQGWSVSYIALMNTLATVLGTDIAFPGDIFAPIILKKPPAAGPTYTFNDVFAVQFLNRVSTQNTRKSF